MAETLSIAGGEAHEAGSIAWRADASSFLPCVGAQALRRHQGSRRPAVRVGTRLDSRTRARGRGARDRGDRTLRRAGDGRHRRLLHAAADRRLHADARRRRRSADVPQRLHHAARVEQHRALPVLPGAGAGRPKGRPPRIGCRARPSGRAPVAGGGAGDAAMEFRRGRPRRAVQAARLERHERAAPQPAVSRSAHAARAPPRRLHRQRQRDADAAGVPAGGARRAAGDSRG